jgi:hypothetical protein
MLVRARQRVTAAPGTSVLPVACGTLSGIAAKRESDGAQAL